MEQRFVIPDRLPGLNEYVDACRSSAYVGNRMKRNAEQQIGWALGGVTPVQSPVLMVFWWYERDRRRDLDNVAFAKKFILDALVKRGILADDGRRHVLGFRDMFEVDHSDPRIEVQLIEETEHGTDRR